MQCKTVIITMVIRVVVLGVISLVIAVIVLVVTIHLCSSPLFQLLSFLHNI